MAWFRKESTRGKPVTLAINGRGVAGSDFGLALLAESDFASDLVSSGLEWFWTSHDPNRRSGYEPETRLVTRLCQESKRAFLDDLPDYGNPEGRDIAMFGIRPDSQNVVQSPADLKNALHTFIAAGAGPFRQFILEKTTATSSGTWQGLVPNQFASRLAPG